jgi:hypothetical protein
MLVGASIPRTDLADADPEIIATNAMTVAIQMLFFMIGFQARRFRFKRTYMIPG